ncbi:histidinol-phosphate aminotransferase [Burkholderiales bacterium]|nr:histidinol-phosphate aminotransferase [Burkholderiales bacterium]
MNDPRPRVAAAASDVDVAARVAATIRAEIRAGAAYAVPKTAGMIELSANENPWPLPDDVRAAVAAAVAAVPVNRYPEGAGDRVKAALVRALPLPRGAAMVLGNGSDELIQIVTTAIARPGACVLAPDPTFVMYRIYAMQAGVRYAGVPLSADFTLEVDAFVAAIAREKPALVWLASPNNPTGRAIPLPAIERILAAAPGLVVVDEAYADFAGTTLLPRVLEFPNLVVMRTVSKIGIAGARLGYAVAHPAWIAELDKVRSPYNVNALTQAAVPVVLAAADTLGAQVAAIRAERGRLAGALAALPGFAVMPSDANFLLVRVPDAPALTSRLRTAGILVKNLHGGHPLTANCLRITVGTPAENDALLAALARP